MITFKTSIDLVTSKWINQSLNECFGRLIMRPHTEANIFCHSNKDLIRLLTSDNVENINPINSKVLDVTVSRPSDNRRQSRTCLPIGAYLLGYARQLLDEQICEIKLQSKEDCRLLMVNTDSCLLALPQNQSLSNIPISSSIGDFKHQIKNSKSLQSFYALSPTAYHITYTTHQGTLEQITKLAGFCLSNVLAHPLSCNDFEKLLDCALSTSKDCEYQIPMKQIRTDRKTQDYPIVKEFIYYLRSKLDDKRVNLLNFDTLSYGFLPSEKQASSD